MDKFNKQRSLSVVAVPDYLVTTLKAHGITLEYIDSTVGNNGDLIVSLTDELKNKLSLNDIMDLDVCNNILNKNIFLTNKVAHDKNIPKAGSDELIDMLPYTTNVLVVNNGLNENARKNIISLYCNKDIDTEAILLSKNKSEIDKVCSFVKTDDTLFIIYHSGFTNFLVYGGEFKNLISKYIIDTMVSGYGEDRAVTSSIFRSFLRLA